MGRLGRIILFCFWCAARAISSDDKDVAEINKLISQLYTEPATEFAYSRQYGKSPEYWESKYKKYYTDKIVSAFFDKIKEPKIEPLPLVEWDPRFSPVLGEFSTMTKLSILNISSQGENKLALVVYYTTDGLNSHTSATEYYLTKTQCGWRISNQWLGCIVDKPWKSKTDLKRILPKNRKPELVDYLE